MNGWAKLMKVLGRTAGWSDDWWTWRARDWNGMVAGDGGCLLWIGRGKLGWCSV